MPEWSYKAVIVQRYFTALQSNLQIWSLSGPLHRLHINVRSEASQAANAAFMHQVCEEQITVQKSYFIYSPNASDECIAQTIHITACAGEFCLSVQWFTVLYSFYI